jgi:hypothetical protein
VQNSTNTRRDSEAYQRARPCNMTGSLPMNLADGDMVPFVGWNHEARQRIAHGTPIAGPASAAASRVADGVPNVAVTATAANASREAANAHSLQGHTLAARLVAKLGDIGSEA